MGVCVCVGGGGGGGGALHRGQVVHCRELSASQTQAQTGGRAHVWVKSTYPCHELGWITVCGGRTAVQRLHLLGKSRGAPDVSEDGVIEEHCVLRHDRHAGSEGLLGDVPQILTIDPDAPRCGVVETKEEPQARGLA